MKIINKLTQEAITFANAPIEGIPNIGEILAVNEQAFMVVEKRWEESLMQTSSGLGKIIQVVLYVEPKGTEGWTLV